jgi:cupin fold WbuC family metalloprotein
LIVSLTRISDEVFLAVDRIVRLGPEEVALLKDQATRSPRRRARICAHRQNGDPVHEMLIAVCADSYIRPHKHVNKIESFHIVSGCVDVVVLDDDGAIAEVIELGDSSGRRPFYYRMADSLFHTLLIRSDILVMHEITNGPFVPEGTVFAPYAPIEDRPADALAYLADLRRRVSALGSKSSERQSQ